MVGSFSIPAFAAADPALIDTTRTGSISLYKYDVTGAEKDGVWDSSLFYAAFDGYDHYTTIILIWRTFWARNSFKHVHFLQGVYPVD